MATEPPVDEPIPKRTDERKFVRNWAFLRLAHEALMVKRVKENAKQTARLAKFAATGNKTDLVAPEANGEGGEDGAEMNIGNEIHNHYQGTPPVETPAAQPTAPPNSGMGTLGSMALGAALLAGTGGVGYSAYDLLIQDNQPAAVDTDTDTDTETTIDVVFPK
jgi:hypothetical protein